MTNEIIGAIIFIILAIAAALGYKKYSTQTPATPTATDQGGQQTPAASGSGTGTGTQTPVNGPTVGPTTTGNPTGAPDQGTGATMPSFIQYGMIDSIIATTQANTGGYLVKYHSGSGATVQFSDTYMNRFSTTDQAIIRQWISDHNGGSASGAGTASPVTIEIISDYMVAMADGGMSGKVNVLQGGINKGVYNKIRGGVYLPVDGNGTYCAIDLNHWSGHVIGGANAAHKLYHIYLVGDQETSTAMYDATVNEIQVAGPDARGWYIKNLAGQDGFGGVITLQQYTEPVQVQAPVLAQPTPAPVQGATPTASQITTAAGPGVYNTTTGILYHTGGR